MEKLFVSIEGDSLLIDELDRNLDSENIQKSKPFPKDSMADPLDASIGAEEVRAIVEAITLIVNFGAGLVALIKAIRDANSKIPNARFILRNSKTGKKIGEIDKNTTDEEIKNMVS